MNFVLSDRFIFRQVYWKDLPIFLRDGELRAKNHASAQVCHQTSYPEIVNRRNSQQFPMPNGSVVNDYVPFYFSPITSFTYTIFKNNVPLISPSGANLGMACEDDRIFLVGRPTSIGYSGLTYCFSDHALNSNAPLPTIETDLNKLESHVHWDVFDETRDKAKIPEIGYPGVCRWFHNMASPAHKMTRSQKRMAEFLVQGEIPLDHIECIIAKTDAMKHKLEAMMCASDWDIPIYAKSGCYFG